MRKRLLIDRKFRQKYFKFESKTILLKYLTMGAGCTEALVDSTDLMQFTNLKNKSFKLNQNSIRSRTNSKIRNYCVISGRGRGLSKNYFSLSRNSFKHLQTLGLLPGVYKTN